jgi:hypothetical protein
MIDAANDEFRIVISPPCLSMGSALCATIASQGGRSGTPAQAILRVMTGFRPVTTTYPRPGSPGAKVVDGRAEHGHRGCPYVAFERGPRDAPLP